MASIPKVLCSGRMNAIISFEEPERIADGAGGFTNDTWNNVIDNVSAYKKHVGGGEHFGHFRLESRVTDIFWIYYMCSASDPFEPLINTLMRIVDIKGDYYNIRKVIDPDDSRHWLMIQAEAGVLD